MQNNPKFMSLNIYTYKRTTPSFCADKYRIINPNYEYQINE